MCKHEVSVSPAVRRLWMATKSGQFERLDLTGGNTARTRALGR